MHYPAATHEAYSECKVLQRDALASPGTFGVDPEKVTLGRPWIKATAAMFPVGQTSLLRGVTGSNVLHEQIVSNVFRAINWGFAYDPFPVYTGDNENTGNWFRGQGTRFGMETFPIEQGGNDLCRPG